MDGVTCRVVLRDFRHQIKDSHTRSNNAKRRTNTVSHHCRRGGACLSTWWSEPPSHWTPQTWSKQGTWILRRQRWELEHDLHLTTSQWGGGGGDTGSGEIYRDLILSVLWDGWINPTLLQSFCSTGGLSRFSVVGFTRLCTDKPKPDSGEELSLFCSVWAQMNLQNLHVGKWHELEELAASSLRSGRIKPKFPQWSDMEVVVCWCGTSPIIKGAMNPVLRWPLAVAAAVIPSEGNDKPKQLFRSGGSSVRNYWASSRGKIWTPFWLVY